MNQWYVVKTKPQQEKRASLNLRNQNFNVISPLIKKKINCEPLFPSYIFVSFDIKKISGRKLIIHMEFPEY